MTNILIFILQFFKILIGLRAMEADRQVDITDIIKF